MRPHRTLAAAVAVLVLALLAAGLAATARAAWQPDDSRLQRRAAAAIDRMKRRRPASGTYFDRAYAYVVFPSVTRAGFGFGGAYGKGVVIRSDRVIGTSGFGQITSGIQIGAKNFTMVVFLRDETALDAYRQNRLQFLGQAGIDLATLGLAGTPAYSEGVAIFTTTRFGLMAEFTISGARFSFQPLAPSAD